MLQLPLVSKQFPWKRLTSFWSPVAMVMPSRYRLHSTTHTRYARDYKNSRCWGEHRNQWQAQQCCSVKKHTKLGRGTTLVSAGRSTGWTSALCCTRHYLPMCGRPVARDQGFDLHDYEPFRYLAGRGIDPEQGLYPYRTAQNRTGLRGSNPCSTRISKQCIHAT
jgi:hypothetical protein